MIFPNLKVDFGFTSKDLVFGLLYLALFMYFRGREMHPEFFYLILAGGFLYPSLDLWTLL